MKKKMLAGILAAALVTASLVGCGGKDGCGGCCHCHESSGQTK